MLRAIFIALGIALAVTITASILFLPQAFVTLVLILVAYLTYNYLSKIIEK